MVNKSRIIEEFCKLVSIDALSFKERQIADVLISKLIQLGFEVEEDDAAKYYSGNCGNIYAFLEGSLPGEPILFSAHMDTVGPGLSKRAVVHDSGLITSDGNTVLGADDLSGIVCIIEAIRTIKDQNLPHRSIEILLTIAEEVYIRGSEVFDYTKIKSKEAYVLDLSGPVGTAALSAPTLFSFTAAFHGKASHAGFAPELGINAIEIAAKAILAIKQGRIDDRTTVNIGLIEGGKALNIVSDECVLKGEVRSLCHEKLLEEIKSIENAFRNIADAYQAGCSFTTEIGCLAYEVKVEHPVVTRFEKACKALGYETKLVDTFGGSDNNNFMKNGITGLVIASGMNKVHSCEEYTHIEELMKGSNIVIKLMTE